MRIRPLVPGDESVVLAGAELFDSPPDEAGAAAFLRRDGHHLLVALDGDHPVGFASGVETTHPDKGTELFLYELSVLEEHRGQGIGKALVEAMGELARERGCYGMWVDTEPDNDAAIATYQAAGAGDPEPAVVLNWTFRGR